MESSGSGPGPKVCSCEHSNELAGSIKGGVFLDQLTRFSSRSLFHEFVGICP
jgi:hypothetical protein